MIDNMSNLKNNLKVVSGSFEYFLKIIYPSYLLIIGILFIYLAIKTGVYHEIPPELREGISGHSFGFTQDIYAVIFHFHMILLVLSMIYAYKSVSNLVLHFVDKANDQTKKVRTGVEIQESGYLFSWDEISGNDNEKLIEYLKENFDDEFVNTAKIEKNKEDNTIKVYTKDKSITLKLESILVKPNILTLIYKQFIKKGVESGINKTPISYENNKFCIKIDEDRNDKFIVKTENGKLKIYKQGLEDIVSKFQQDLMSKRQLYLAVIFVIGTLLFQTYVQINRIESMDIIYWWDWRINKITCLLRLLNVLLAFFVITMLTCRARISIIFIRNFLNFVKLTPRPLHPDGAGGLSIIGKVCIKFTIPMIIFGINLIASFFLHEGTAYLVLHLAGFLIYIVGIVFIFYYPLISVHKVMNEQKNKWLDEISDEIDKTLSRLGDLLKNDSKDPDSEFKRLDNLKKYHSTVQEMPIWPYDLTTISRLVSSIMIPFVLFIYNITK